MTERTEPKVITTEFCPFCGTLNNIVRAQGKDRYSGNSAGVADIMCECGIHLRPVVPIFRTTPSGYELKNMSGTGTKFQD